MFKALTIAGSDTSGGAGLQADIKTFQEYDVYGMSAITVIVAQNPAKGWAHEVFPVDPAIVSAQIDTVLGGIGVNALKTGMLPTEEIIAIAAEKIREYGARNVVIDPVMVCKGANEVVNPGAAGALARLLMPLADIATPNLFEAAQLSGSGPITDIPGMEEAARRIHALGARHVFIKGGAKLGGDDAADLFYDGAGFEVFSRPVIRTKNTHGAGCTTAAAITAGLARGLSPYDAVKKAKEFVSRAIENGFALNGFVGATRHSANRTAG